ncbi:hypothetical protein T440DRAFT_472514 [Plenodomus tracheiphilus IPT5]|uniref:Zn(2)-C6 fungal-type domain-containing protein n=1 Tax=Plenodomus tracheiphilus IPT5 TaxID=1408161 RepID=A0A6A7AR42_9PLEO|nr:hypothetical protein T440DRAFT_472514 [Plenodomus tracheiphilus IPT5]
MNDHGIKNSQRVSRSCIECGRRKIRCDKRSPCQPCIRRNAAHECRRPIARVRGQLTVYADTEMDSTADIQVEELLRERAALRAQIVELETALALSKSYTHSRTGASDNPTSHSTSLEELVPAFERFDLDIIPDALAVTEKEIADQLYEPVTDPIFLLLPTREASHQIVTFSLRTLGWLHCAVNADAFLAEHREFWELIQIGAGLAGERRPWLILYLSLLAVGVLYIEPLDLPPFEQLPQLALVPDSPIDVAVHVSRLWYESALKEIERHGFAGTPSFPVVQALAVLTLCHSNFGEHQREWLFTGFATNMARCLDMHKLGREVAFPKDLAQKPEWASPLSRELGRKLWWACVIRDWLSSWGRPPTISPASFCCQFSLHRDFDTTIPTEPMFSNGQTPSETSNLVTPSPAHYHSIMSRLSYIIYIYIKGNAQQTPPKLAKAVEEIEKVRAGLPLHLSSIFPANDEDTQWERQYPWIHFQRYLISYVIDFMQLSILRLLVLKDSEEGATDYRKLAIEAALRQLNRYAAPAPRVFRLVWAVSAATAAAALYVALDMLLNPAQYHAESKMRMIGLLRHVGLELKQHAAVAVHAARGSSVMESLLPLITQAHPSQPGTNYTLHGLLQRLSTLNQSVYSVPDDPPVNVDSAMPDGSHESSDVFAGTHDTFDADFDLNDWDNLVLQF